MFFTRSFAFDWVRGICAALYRLHSSCSHQSSAGQCHCGSVLRRLGQPRTDSHRSTSDKLRREERSFFLISSWCSSCISLRDLSVAFGMSVVVVDSSEFCSFLQVESFQFFFQLILILFHLALSILMRFLILDIPNDKWVKLHSKRSSYDMLWIILFESHSHPLVFLEEAIDW